MDTALKKLASRIGQLIDESTYSRSDVARHLKVDRSVVTLWVQGKRTPQMKNLIDLAELMGVEMSELWDDGESLPSTPEQRVMLELMRDLSPEAQQMLIANAKLLGSKS